MTSIRTNSFLEGNEEYVDVRGGSVNLFLGSFRTFRKVLSVMNRRNSQNVNDTKHLHKVKQRRLARSKQFSLFIWKDYPNWHFSSGQIFKKRLPYYLVVKHLMTLRCPFAQHSNLVASHQPGRFASFTTNYLSRNGN